MADLALADNPEASTTGNTGELAIADSNDANSGGKILGSRDFARYYKQSHRPPSSNRQTRLAELQQR